MSIGAVGEGHVIVNLLGPDNAIDPMWVCSCGGSSDSWQWLMQDESVKTEVAKLDKVMQLTIGDVLDLLMECPRSVSEIDHGEYYLKEGIDPHAAVNVIGTLTAESNLNVMVSDDDGSLCIMEV
jgi:hypothetical protein